MLTFTIDPSMSFNEVVAYYKKYLAYAKANGIKPVSFLHFLTGRS